MAKILFCFCYLLLVFCMVEFETTFGREIALVNFEKDINSCRDLPIDT